MDLCSFVSCSPWLCLSRGQVHYRVCSAALVPSFPEQGGGSSVPPACLDFPLLAHLALGASMWGKEDTGKERAAGHGISDQS